MYNAGRLEKDEERWRGKSKRQYAKSGKSADKKKQEEDQEEKLNEVIRKAEEQAASIYKSLEAGE